MIENGGEVQTAQRYIAASIGTDDRVLWAGFGLLQLFMAQFVYLWFRSSTVVAFTQQQKVLLLMLVRILATSFRLLPIELRWRSGLGGLAQRGQRLQD